MNHLPPPKRSARRLRVINNAQSLLDFALHSSSILITAAVGQLTVWDLQTQGERLRTINLTDDTVPLAMTPQAGSLATNRLLLHGNRVLCDLGCLIKTVVLPFPVRSNKSK